MSEILTIFVIIFQILLCGGIGVFLYKYFSDSKKKDKIQSELGKTLKKNLKNKVIEDNILPDDWLKNDNSENMDAFIENTVESKFSGTDINQFLGGLKNGSQNMFMSIFSNMLTDDNALLKTLSEKLGISPMIAKPILITALSGVSTFANNVLTNVLSRKLSETAEQKGFKREKKAQLPKEGLLIPNNFQINF